MEPYRPIISLPDVADEPWARPILEDRRIVESFSKNLRFYDEPFLHQYSVKVCGTATGPTGQEVTAGGAAFNCERALMKAAGEAAERFCLTQVDPACLEIGSFANMAPTLDAEQFRFFGRKQFADPRFSQFAWPDEGLLRWYPGHDLVSRQEVMLPAQLLFVPYDVCDEATLFPTTTTGGACGRTREDSALRGMLEAIERDAFMVHYLGKVPGTRIITEGSPVLEEIKDYLRRFMLRVELFSLGTDFPVTTVLALVIDEGPKGFPAPWFSAGMKCDFDPMLACLGAIEEACQTRPWIRSKLQDIQLGTAEASELANDVIVDRALYWSKAHRKNDLDFLMSSRDSVRLADMPKAAAIGGPEQLDALLQYSRDEGHPVYIAELTAGAVKEHGLVVTKVVMPTLQQFYLVEPFVPLGSERWRSVPPIIGKPAQSAPNAIPHFFL